MINERHRHPNVRSTAAAPKATPLTAHYALLSSVLFSFTLFSMFPTCALKATVRCCFPGHYPVFSSALLAFYFCKNFSTVSCSKVIRKFWIQLTHMRKYLNKALQIKLMLVYFILHIEGLVPYLVMLIHSDLQQTSWNMVKYTELQSMPTIKFLGCLQC